MRPCSAQVLAEHTRSSNANDTHEVPPPPSRPQDPLTKQHHTHSAPPLLSTSRANVTYKPSHKSALSTHIQCSLQNSPDRLMFPSTQIQLRCSNLLLYWYGGWYWRRYSRGGWLRPHGSRLRLGWRGCAARARSSRRRWRRCRRHTLQFRKSLQADLGSTQVGSVRTPTPIISHRWAYAIGIVLWRAQSWRRGRGLAHR